MTTNDLAAIRARNWSPDAWENMNKTNGELLGEAIDCINDLCEEVDFLRSIVNTPMPEHIGRLSGRASRKEVERVLMYAKIASTSAERLTILHFDLPRIARDYLDVVDETGVLRGELERERDYAASKHAEYLALWQSEKDESKSEYWDGVATAYKNMHDRLNWLLRDNSRREVE